MLSCAATNSSAARSRTLRVSSSGWKAKSNASRPFVVRQPGQLERGAKPAALAQADFLAEQQINELALSQHDHVWATSDSGVERRRRQGCGLRELVRRAGVEPTTRWLRVT